MFRKANCKKTGSAAVLMLLAALSLAIPHQLLGAQAGSPASHTAAENNVTINKTYFTNLQQGSAEVLNKQILLKTGRQTLGNVLHSIARQLDLKLSFSSALVPMKKTVVIEEAKASAETILWEVLRDTGFRFAVSSSGQLVILKDPTRNSKKSVATGTVSGTVLDAGTGESLPGASIYIEGTTKGVSSNADGEFSIDDVEAGTHMLVTSFVGYEKNTREITVTGGEELNLSISLKKAATALDEMVVVGYGSTQKRDLTGSISSINSEELLTQPSSSSFDQLLGGKMSGVQVSQVGGEAGKGAIVNIRGAASITGDNQPLYVVDGVPVLASQQVPEDFNNSLGGAQSANPLLSINPNNIESVNVLKDASAAAIYGSRAANGVVIITTKRGAGAESSSLNVGYNVNVERFVNEYELMGPEEYRQYAITTAENTLEINPFNTDAQQIVDNQRPDGTPYFRSGRTDWVDQLTNSSGVTQNFDLSYGGGSEITSYFVALNSKLNQGLFEREDFESYNIRANVDSEPVDRLKLSASMSYNLNQDKAGFATDFRSAFFFQPTFNVFNEDGSYTKLVSLSGDERYNPVARNREISRQQEGRNFIGTASAALQIADGLEIKSQFNANLLTTDIDNYQSNLFRVFQSELYGQREIITTESRNTFWDNTLSYDTDLNEDHHLKGVLGASYEQRELSTRSITGIGYSNDAANSLSSAERISQRSQDEQIGVLHSYFARMNYDFKSKYYVTFTGRADGSSKFGPENRWGFFPSGALAWRVSEESFLKDSEIISSLKLRTSYGETGLANLPEFQFRRLYAPADAFFGSTFYNGTPGLISNGIPNAAIQWETNKQFDAAVEFGLLQERITGEINYYNNESSGLILRSTISPSTGFAKQNKNVGSISNKGWEFALGADIIQKPDFNWHSSFNISFNTNRLEDLNGGTFFDFGNPGSIVEGEPLGNIRGYIVDGFFQDQEEIAELNANAPDGSYQSFASQQVGNYKYRDVNGDGHITSDDQVNLGNTQADYFGGWNNNFSYKGVELTVNFQFSQGLEKIWGDQGNYITSSQIDKNNIQGALKDMWAPDNPDAQFERPYFVSFKGPEATIPNSREVYDASYFRLKVMRLAYNLPRNFLGNTPLGNVRVYAQATNLWTVTDWPGLDPELVTSSNVGLNTYNTTRNIDGYPLSQTFTAGINISF